MNVYMKQLLMAPAFLALVACGGESSNTASTTITPPSATGGSSSSSGGGTTSGGTSGSVDISGTITYDHVPFSTATNGLNYAAITPRPVRGVIIEAVDGNGTVLDTATTNANGDYSVTVNSNTDVRIRANAQLLQTSGASWDVKVTDNTSANALYSLQGSLTSSGTANASRDLHAASGWSGSAYSSTRAAAPFAILSPIYDTVQNFAAVDSDVNFPALEFRWSVNNRAAGGDYAAGDIGTSSYVTQNGVGSIYILGDANSDTDEYDDHVIIHEWGHYFEDRMSRSDSIGGSHGGADRLDPRVAMGEGWGNALSAMMTNDPFYRDSSGNAQSMGFYINVEQNTVTNEGWFNESSVQSILYDIFDRTNETGDNIALGLGPIYETMTSAPYKAQTGFTTIFGFLDLLQNNTASAATGIAQLKSGQNITGSGLYGAGETNTGGAEGSIPVYKQAPVNGGAVTICSVNDNGAYNKLGNRHYVRFTAAISGTHTITMTKTSGPATRDPDFTIYNQGVVTAQAGSSVTDSETWMGNLGAGEYVIDAFDYLNINSGSNSGDSCFDFTVAR